MMSNCLFSYRRVLRAQDGTETVHDNFISPLGVISFYWGYTDSGAKVLNVFLFNGKTVVFYETVGNKFVDHMETFLRSQCGLVGNTPRQYQGNKARSAGDHGSRMPIEAEVIDDIQELRANFVPET